MSTGVAPVTAWGGILLVVTALGVLVFGLDWLPALLLGTAGAGAALTGIVTGFAGRRGGDAPGPVGPSVSPDSSLASVLVPIGGALALVGSVLGTAFLWPGVGLMALGFGGVVRELRAARRRLR